MHCRVQSCINCLDRLTRHEMDEQTVEVEIKSRDFTAKQEEERGELQFKLISNDGSPTHCQLPAYLLTHTYFGIIVCL